MQKVLSFVKLIVGEKLYLGFRNYFLLKFNHSPIPLIKTRDATQIDLHLDSEFSKKIQDSIKNFSITEFEKVIYIISPMQRSGTNFLRSILSLHSDVQLPHGDGIPREQFVFSYIQDLISYAKKTVNLWEKWYKTKEFRNYFTLSLLGNLGNGITCFFKQFISKDKILVLRSPDSKESKYLPYIFPNGKFIVIVRDGRDTVDSFLTSWGNSFLFKTACKRWANRMKHVDELVLICQKIQNSENLKIITFNALVEDPKGTVKDILIFLNLELNRFDWSQVDKLPILGSSTHRGKGGEVNWKPIKKDGSFKPQNKWKKWNKRKKEYFFKIANHYLIKYNLEEDNNWYNK